MNLENFVAEMGINVIQVIDQIQSDRRGGGKKKTFVDADKFIDKDWYKKRLSSTSRAGHVTVKYYGEERKKYTHNISSEEEILERPKNIFSMIQEVKKKTLKNECSSEICEESRTFHGNSTATNLITLTGSKAIDVCKNNNNLEDLKPSKVKIAISPFSLCSSKKNKKNNDLFRTTLWKRPKPVKWCSTKDFLSKKIKTHKDACELVSRRDGVIVRNAKDDATSNEEEIEYFSLTPISTDIEFIVPLLL